MHNLSSDQLIYPRSSPEVIDIVSGGQRTRLQAHGSRLQGTYLLLLGRRIQRIYSLFAISTNPVGIDNFLNVFLGSRMKHGVRTECLFTSMRLRELGDWRALDTRVAAWFSPPCARSRPSPPGRPCPRCPAAACAGSPCAPRPRHARTQAAEDQCKIYLSS